MTTRRRVGGLSQPRLSCPDPARWARPVGLLHGRTLLDRPLAFKSLRARYLLVPGLRWMEKREVSVDDFVASLLAPLLLSVALPVVTCLLRFPGPCAVVVRALAGSCLAVTRPLPSLCLCWSRRLEVSRSRAAVTPSRVRHRRLLPPFLSCCTLLHRMHRPVARGSLPPRLVKGLALNCVTALSRCQPLPRLLTAGGWPSRSCAPRLACASVVYHPRLIGLTVAPAGLWSSSDAGVIGRHL